MKIAIYGLSATGKTVVASALAQLLGFTIRNCGEIVKSRTKALGLQSPSQLSLNEHMLIDKETREIASNLDQDIIIEGRYLNNVLSGYDQIFFVELVCSDHEREMRMTGRNPSQSIDNSLINNDKEYCNLRQELYGSLPPELKHSISINALNNTVEQCAQLIVNNINIT